MRYKRGESGNPAGKPKGTPSKVTRLRALLEPHAEALIGKAVELAKSGDTVALRLCLERLIPALKVEGRPVMLPTLTPDGALAEQGRAVLIALADGSVTPDEAATLMQTVAGLARIVEVDELERRVAALETKQGQRKEI